MSLSLTHTYIWSLKHFGPQSFWKGGIIITDVSILKDTFTDKDTKHLLRNDGNWGPAFLLVPLSVKTLICLKPETIYEMYTLFFISWIESLYTLN